MSQITLPYSGPVETLVTWPHAVPGERVLETSPVRRGGFHTLIRVQPAARFLRVPAGYEVTVTAKDAESGSVLWRRAVNSTRSINCPIIRDHRVRFTVELPPSENVRAPLFPLKRVWNPRVTLTVCDGTSGYLADEHL